MKREFIFQIIPTEVCVKYMTTKHRTTFAIGVAKKYTF